VKLCGARQEIIDNPKISNHVADTTTMTAVAQEIKDV